MTNLKKVLLASAAVTMLSGAAWAGSNKAFVDQQNNNNEATIYQDQANNSEVGTENNPVLQNGDYNDLVIDQDGDAQKVGAAGGDFEQNGYGNDARILQGQGDADSRNNNVSNVRQEATGAAGDDFRNRLNVNQQGQDNTISTVRQTNRTGAGINTATINQTDTATSNVVQSASQEGNSNTLTITQGGGSGNTVISASQQSLYGGGGNALTLTQTGSANQIDIAQESGQGTQNTANLTFVGDGNGNTGYNAPFNTQGVNDVGDGNDVRQIGDNHSLTGTFTGNGNLFGVRQYSNAVGAGSSATLTVNGAYNDLAVYQSDINGGGGVHTAVLTIDGDDNSVGVDQNGYDNNADVVISGGSTNNANQVAIVQRDQSNDVNLRIRLNGNKFVSNQQGVGNDIDADIYGYNNNVNVRQAGTRQSSDVNIDFASNNAVNISQLSGSDNQATVNIGNYSDNNTSTITQNGTSNVALIGVGVGQSSYNTDYNTATINQNGVGNSASVYQ